jgi:hypothetical protein
VALDQLGKPLGELSYGAGLARYLKAKEILVMEVERPKRRNLRRNGARVGPQRRRGRSPCGVGRRGRGRTQESGDGRVEIS